MIKHHSLLSSSLSGSLLGWSSGLLSWSLGGWLLGSCLSDWLGGFLGWSGGFLGWSGGGYNIKVGKLI